MAFNFLKKTAKPAIGTHTPTTTKKTSGDDTGGAATAQGEKTLLKKPMSWLKQGSQAKEAFATDEARAEAAKLEASKMWRFRMDPQEEFLVTFLNGELDSDAILDVPAVIEHTVETPGRWKSYVCTADNEPCPICEANKYRPTTVGMLTILDHTRHKIMGGPKRGQIIEHQRKLYPAKRGTIKILTGRAKKHDGLAGCQFKIGRTDGQAPAVGNEFEFIRKFSTYDEIAETYGLTLDDVLPAVVTDELIYYTADELIAMGLGRALKGPGYTGGKKSFGSGGKTTAKDLADKM